MEIVFWQTTIFSLVRPV